MKHTYHGSNGVYSAPFLGNGEMAFQVGPDGSMNPDTDKTLIRSNPSRLIFWEARRYRSIQTKNLIPFGRFTQKVTADSDKEILVERCGQSLDTLNACVECESVFSDGSEIDSVVFLNTDFNLIAIKKTFRPKSALTYSFTYTLCDKDGNLPFLVEADAAEDVNSGIISYRATDQVNCAGAIRVFCDTPVTTEAANNHITLTLKVDSPLTVCFYLIFADKSDHVNPAGFVLEKQSFALAEGFERIKARLSEVWSEYCAEGCASIGDEVIDKVYITAQYHLKCFSTKWSLPVGINDTNWEGKFFAFDEHFMFLGLLTSNHINAASKVPYFRKEGLPIAVRRASSKHHNTARYPWETIEDGSEAATPGFWYDHIFHMPSIALTEYYYYLYTGDIEFLRETAYPVITACVEFLRIHMLYRVDGGRLIVGKCTDLERLGSSVENPYMTTCGVVAAFRAYCEASRMLGINIDKAGEYDVLAEELLAALPNDGSRYIPYPGCGDRSISAFSGTFPFPAIDKEDPMQSQAISDYLKYEDSFGNMYAVGSGLCSWYSCWKSVAYSRLGRAGDACEALGYAAMTAGNFGELFEINNPESQTYYRPWFTTAAGMYMHAMNETLLQCSGADIYIAPALDDGYREFSFKLASHGGIVVCAAASNGRITQLEVSGNVHCQYESVRLHIPSRFDASDYNPDEQGVVTVKVTK